MVDRTTWPCASLPPCTSCPPSPCGSTVPAVVRWRTPPTRARAGRSPRWAMTSTWPWCEATVLAVDEHLGPGGGLAAQRRPGRCASGRPGGRDGDWSSPTCGPPWTAHLAAVEGGRGFRRTGDDDLVAAEGINLQRVGSAPMARPDGRRTRRAAPRRLRTPASPTRPTFGAWSASAAPWCCAPRRSTRTYRSGDPGLREGLGDRRVAMLPGSFADERIRRESVKGKPVGPHPGDPAPDRPVAQGRCAMGPCSASARSSSTSTSSRPTAAPRTASITGGYLALHDALASGGQQAAGSPPTRSPTPAPPSRSASSAACPWLRPPLRRGPDRGRGRRAERGDDRRRAGFVEVQGTAEGMAFSRDELGDSLLDLAHGGIGAAHGPSNAS